MSACCQSGSVKSEWCQHNIFSYIAINAKIIWTRGVFGSLRMSFLYLSRERVLFPPCFCLVCLILTFLPSGPLFPPLAWISHPFSVFTCVLFVNPVSVYIVCLLPHVFVSLSSVIHLSLLLPVSSSVSPCHLVVCFWFCVFSLCFLCFCLYFVSAFVLPICILASCHSWFWDNIALGLCSFC